MTIITINPMQRLTSTGRKGYYLITRARTSINRLSFALTVEFSIRRSPNNCPRYPRGRLSVVKHQQVPHYSLHSGLFRYHNRVWVGADLSLEQQLINEFHCSAWGGHSGVPITFMRLQQCFAWRCMKSAIKEFVQSCLTCQ
jgi:hypothetical protein